jgi:carbon monoxide dehydrogenase subunit G
MHLQNLFAVPVARQSAFAILQDLTRIAQCFPGATVGGVRDDGSFEGEVEVRLGPMQVTYRGEARFTSLDEPAGAAVLEAKGREARGNGMARAVVTVQLQETSPEHTEVMIDTELHITGRPAQFGRGVIDDVSRRMLSEFADCLQRQLGESGSGLMGRSDS